MLITKENLRKIINQACIRNNVSYAGLASIMDVGTASIYRWADGRQPSLEHLVKLLKAANINDLSLIW